MVSTVILLYLFWFVLSFKIKSRLCIQLPQSEEVSPSSCNTDKVTPSPGPEPKNKFSWPTLKQMKQIFLVDQSWLETKILLSFFAKMCKFDNVFTKNIIFAKCSFTIIFSRKFYQFLLSARGNIPFLIIITRKRKLDQKCATAFILYRFYGKCINFRNYFGKS